jgi:hypothetical protein
MIDVTLILVATLPVAGLAVLWISYRTTALYAARRGAQRAVAAICKEHLQVQAVSANVWSSLVKAAERWAAECLQTRLRSTPIEDLKHAGVSNVRWSALRSAGYQSLADLHGVAPGRLQSLPGVGPTTAGRVTYATAAVVQSIQAEPVPLPSDDVSEPQAAALVQHTRTWMRVQALDTRPVAAAAESTAQRLRSVQAKTGFLAWIGTLFSGAGPRAIAEGERLASEAQSLQSAPAFQSLLHAMRDIDHQARSTPPVAELASHYRSSSGQYAAVMKDVFAGRHLPSHRAPVVDVVAPTAPSGQGLGTQPAIEPVRVRVEGPQATRSYAIPDAPARSDRALTVTVTISGPTEETRVPDDAIWHAPGDEVRIGDYRIPGGMLYVGRNLASISPYRGPEPALVNPDLAIEPKEVDWSAERMPYWPSYGEVPPECRGAYLRWLAEGRRDTTVGIGYVFLFFYGLERRLLHDGGKGKVPDAERRTILAEVEQLLAVYGAQRSFRRYAADFLAVVSLQSASTRGSDAPPPRIEPGDEMPLSVSAGLGEIVRAGRPIPADWAIPRPAGARPRNGAAPSWSGCLRSAMAPHLVRVLSSSQTGRA